MKLGWILLFVLFVLVGFLIYNTYSPLAMYPSETKVALAKKEFDAVIDVRTDAEWNLGHYPLAIHIPTKELAERLPMAVKDKQAKILFYCNTSTRSRMAAEKAQSLGYPNVRYLIGTHLNLM